jgi:hypothetical protein
MEIAVIIAAWDRSYLIRTIFLGASLAGYDWRKDLVGKWSTVLKKARYRLIAGEFLSLSGWSFNDTPALEHFDRNSGSIGGPP